MQNSPKNTKKKTKKQSDFFFVKNFWIEKKYFRKINGINNIRFTPGVSRPDIKNIYLISNGEITSWILACKLLIQDGCTTAIEGYMGNKPTISFQPIDELNYEMFLPSVVSTKTRTISDVVEIVNIILN